MRRAGEAIKELALRGFCFCTQHCLRFRVYEDAGSFKAALHAAHRE
jgi:hypothetical protein